MAVLARTQHTSPNANRNKAVWGWVGLSRHITSQFFQRDMYAPSTVAHPTVSKRSLYLELRSARCFRSRQDIVVPNIGLGV